MNNNSYFSNFFYDSNIKKILDEDINKSQSILFFDYCGARDIYSVVDEIAENIAPIKFHMVSALTTRKEWEEKINLKFGNLIKPPREVWYGKNNAMKPLSYSSIRENKVQNIDILTSLLQRAVENGVQSVDSNIVRNQIETTYYFSSMVIRLIKPRLVIIWNEFHPLSQVTIQACKDNNVQYSFFEYGVLPSTLNFDFQGQMGGSSIATDASNFKKLPVSVHDIAHANRSLHFILSANLNRKEQPPYNGLHEKARLKARGRKIIFFAGHNDIASGVIPYNEYAQHHHSPIFPSSHEAAKYILSLAQENGWYVLYKPHPLDTRSVKIDTSDNHMMASDYNLHECIDTADLTVTTLSQTSIMSMIRNKSVVMLGYNHLRDSGAIYQCSKLSDITENIELAYAQGITKSMEKSWHYFTARLLKYYLFNYGKETHELVGAQNTKELACNLISAIEDNDFRDFYKKNLDEIKNIKVA